MVELGNLRVGPAEAFTQPTLVVGVVHRRAFGTLTVFHDVAAERLFVVDDHHLALQLHGLVGVAFVVQLGGVVAAVAQDELHLVVMDTADLDGLQLAFGLKRLDHVLHGLVVVRLPATVEGLIDQISWGSIRNSSWRTTSPAFSFMDICVYPVGAMVVPVR